jgi:hypothetical protein
MKKLLVFLFSLLSLTAVGQGKQKVEVRKKGAALSSPPLYTVEAIRDKTKYPLGSLAMTNSFTTAAVSGAFNLTVLCESGARPVIPKGTRPPTVSPCPTSAVSATSTIGLAVRYTYGANKLQLRGSGTGEFQMMIEPVDGRTLTLSNEQNPVLHQSQFYSPGLVNDGSTYTLDWTFQGVPQIPLKLSFRRDGVTYVRTITPVVTATAQQLFVAANSSPPTTTPAYSSTFAQLFVSQPDQGWSGSDVKTISNGRLTLGFKRSLGAALYSAIYNLKEHINDLIVNPNGTPISDKGRQDMKSVYRSPRRAFLINGYSTVTEGYDTGDNGVQGGNKDPHFDVSTVYASAIYDHPTLGTMFYAKFRPKVWGVPNTDWTGVIEQWFWMDGNAWGQYYRMVTEPGFEDQRQFKSEDQENPSIYAWARFTDQRIPVGTPGSGSTNFFPSNYQQENFSKNIFSSECRAGVYGQGTGLTIYSPIDANYKVGQFSNIDDGPNGHGASYVANCGQRNYDSPGTYEDWVFVILGTESEAVAKIATLPPIDQSVNFLFNTVDNKWQNGDCRAKLENGQWTVYVGDQKEDNGHFSTNGSFTSPVRAWSNLAGATLKFDMAVTGTDQLRFTWDTPGVSGQNHHEMTIPVNGDGVRRTYTVTPAWSGVISCFGLQGNDHVQAGVGKLIMYSVTK